MNRRGMTLIELVVALTVAGFAMAAGYGALGSMIDHRARAEAAGDSAAVAAARRRLLTQWLLAAHLMPTGDGPGFRGLDGIYEGMADDQLCMLTRGSTALGGEQVVVQLYIDRDYASAERGLTAKVSGLFDTVTRVIEIEPRAGGLDLRFSTRMLGAPEWLPSWISSTLLPAGVELTLAPAAGDTLPSLLRWPITVPLGSGR